MNEDWGCQTQNERKVSICMISSVLIFFFFWSLKLVLVHYYMEILSFMEECQLFGR